MEELIQLINKVFDENYFEVKSYIIPYQNENAYCIDVIYIPDNTCVHKIKQYYTGEFSAEDIKKMESNSNL